MKYWKDRERKRIYSSHSIITININMKKLDWTTMMNTLAFDKKLKSFGPKQILLTLKKDPEHYGMTAVIAPIGKNRELKITNKKLIKISINDGQNLFLEKMDNSKRCNTYQFLPKISQASKIQKRRIFPNTKQCSILKNPLVSESVFCKNLHNILYKDQINDNQNKRVNLESDLRDLRHQDLASNLNKHDRFVPNILRSTRMAENNFNSNGIIRFDQNNHEGEEHCKDNKNVKRKRKQVLSSLSIKNDWTWRTQILNKKNELTESVLKISDHNLAEKSGNKNIGIIETNSEQKDIKKCPEIKPKNSVTVEELTMDFCPPNDLYTANIDISYQNQKLPCQKEVEFNCNVDKSIKKIFAEFEVADYQNYIDSTDICFDIDEMDKLLGFDIGGSSTESSILDHNTKMVEHDVNGNDIDNYGLCEIKRCYNDISKQQINTSRRLNRGIDLNAMWEDSRSYTTSEINLSSTEFEDYYSSDDIQDFHQGLEQDSSSTDTASESETNESNSTSSIGLFLSNIENVGCCRTPFAVSDILPDHVLSTEPNQFCSDGSESFDYTVKRSLDSIPKMQQYHLNSNDINENNYTSLPGLQLENHANNFQMNDRCNGSFEFFEDGNFLVDNMLNINCAVSEEDETCESILAKSNAKFDDKNALKLLNNIPDFDIENANDIELSRLLKVGNTHASNPPNNELSMDMANEDNTQFASIKLENSMQLQAEGILNESTYSNASESLKFLPDNQVETGKLQSVEEFELFNLAPASISSISEELLSPCDAVVKDIDGRKTSSQCSSPLLIEKQNMNVLKSLESESLLARTQTFEDYTQANYLSAISCDITHSENGNNKHSLHLIENSINIESCNSQVTGHKNFEDISYSSAAWNTNVNDQRTAIDLDDEYTVAERRNHDLSKLDLSYNSDLNNYQSVSYSASSKKSVSSRKRTVNFSDPKKGLWKDLLKRHKSVIQNITYLDCEFCEKRYRSKEALTDHINRNHRYRFGNRDKKYVCDKCSKEYCIAGAIERHFKLHENYILTCRICEKHFSEKVYLRRHVHSSHLDWKFQCDYCGRKFSRRNDLTRHLKRCHDLQDFFSESID